MPTSRPSRAFAGALVALVLVAALGAAACGGDDDGSGGGEKSTATPAAATDLEAQSWQLQSYAIRGADDLSGASQTSPATAEFASGNASGSTGCNNYNVTYELSANGQISFGQVAATKAACPEELGPQEQALFNGYARATKAVIDDGALQFLGPGGDPLLFFQPVKGTQLEGISWTVLNYRTPTAVTSALAGADVTATFSSGTITGNAGCNDYTAAYTGGAGTSGPLKITSVKLGTKTCTSPAGVAQQEQAYAAALATVTKFETGSNRLTLLDAQGRDAVTFSGS